jgi:hypothetical protein
MYTLGEGWSYYVMAPRYNCELSLVRPVCVVLTLWTRCVTRGIRVTEIGICQLTTNESYFQLHTTPEPLIVYNSKRFV